MSLTAPVTDPIWEKLLTRKVQHKFSLFAANLKVDLAARDYAQNHSDKQKLISTLHEFFTKYERLTSADLAQISR
jgi:hypothetical protein